MTIRNFHKTDKDIFLRFARDLYTSDAVMHSVPRCYFEKTFDLITNGTPYANGLIIEQDGIEIGYALVSLTYSNEVGGMVVWLEEIYIMPEYQNSGIGTELLRFREKEYHGKAKRIRLEVAPNNTRAIQLYHRLGYRELNYLQMFKDLD